MNYYARACYSKQYHTLTRGVNPFILFCGATLKKVLGIIHKKQFFKFAYADVAW